ncbi:MAG: phosphatase PAP2 family protein [Candidatus Solibacter sp.]|nr:phosphatase PAP2 family protein [Candidatus Solibacter sp.]
MIRSRFHPARDAAIALGAVLVFALLARLAAREIAPGFDMAGREAIHAYARPWLTLVMRVASFAGGGWVLWPGGAMIVACLARAGRRRDAVLFAVAVAGANLVSETMKLFFHRPRPEPWFGYPLPFTFSFPSGHALVSFCFCLCLAEILIRDEWPLAGKVAMWSGALAATLTVGLSRVYLGVHYPSDVLAGYAAAIAWTTLIRAAHHLWRGRSEIKRNS